MAKKIYNQYDLLACPELYVLDKHPDTKQFKNGQEGSVVIGAATYEQAESFEAGRAAERHAETKMGWTKAGNNGDPKQRLKGTFTHTVTDENGQSRKLVLRCVKYYVEGTY